MRHRATRRIVVDSSAVIAMMLNETSAAALVARLATDPDRVMSIASYLEAGTVLAGRRRRDRLKAIDELDALLAEIGIDLVPVDIAQGRLALAARITHARHGPWRHAQFRRRLFLCAREVARCTAAVRWERLFCYRYQRGAAPLD